MKKLFTLIVVCLTAVSTWAYDVEVGGIYYNLVTKTKTAEVTYKGATYDEVKTYSGSVTIPETFVSDGVTYSVTSIGSNAFRGCTGLTSVAIPNSVTSIGYGAFCNCTGLTSLTIPNSVTSIGGYAFRNCSGLTSVAIPNSVTSIGDDAFDYCKGLTSVTIPNSVTSIGSFAFSYCSGLTSVTIGNSVTSIGSYAFSECKGLTSVHITDIASWCKISFSVSTSNPLYYAHHLFLNDEEIKDLVIPNSVTSIGTAAFYNCSGLTSVTIPNSVTSIGGAAFASCSGLKSVSIPNSVTSIGNDAFYNCTGLTSVTIGNSVTSIGNDAFYECTGLTSVHITDIASWCEISFGYSDSNPLNYARHLYLNDEEIKDLVIPNSVTSIGECAFRVCTGLTSVTIPNSVTSIGGSAFCDCTSLTSLTIGNSVTSIGNSAFYGCSGLTSVTIPNSVTSIGDGAFYGCSGVKTVSIGTGIKTIYSQAFASCKNVETVTCYAENVPSMGTDVFKDSYVSYATLKVPDASVDLYKAADQWKEFGTIQGLNGTDPTEPTTKKCAKPSIAYEDNKLYFVTATPNADIVSEITDADVAKHYDSTVSLTATYNITAYATKSGYDNSDTATATLVWATGSLTDGINEAKTISVDALPLLITQDEGMVTISGLNDGDTITAYSSDGKQVAMTKAAGNAALLNLSDLRGKVAVLSVNGRSAKVMVK